MKTFTVNPDNTVTVTEMQADNVTPARQWVIAATNLRQHRRDAAFDTEIKAALTSTELTKLAAAADAPTVTK
jgi:hypothetical protein